MGPDPLAGPPLADDYSPLIEEKFVELIETASGIVFDPVKRQELKQDLQLRMGEIAEPSFVGYWELLGAPAGADELKRLINLITINETYFFRVAEHFDLLRRVVVPALLQERSDPTLRVWSAGCSSGEEVYSVLIQLLEIPELRNHRIQALGTDINDDMLYVAQRGIYSGRTLNKVPESVLHRYFEPVLSRLRVRAAVRERAEFRRLNLMELPETGQPSGLDIIFFRNVLIYFNRETTRRIIRAMHHRLAPGGFLFLGPSETLWDISSDFDCLMFENSYLYRKKPAVAGPAAGPPVIPAFVAPLPVPPPPARPGADAPPPSKARVLLEEAELMVDLGDYDRAQGLVDEVLFLEPDSRSAMMLKLTLLANLNRGRELLRAAERFVQRVPIFPELHYLLGRFHESQKRVPEAMQEYRRVLFIGADYLQARDRLLRLLVAAGETDNARREARNIYDQLLTGRFRSFPPGVAEPLNSAELKKRCLSISEP